jgi:hypothetical protein
MRWKWATGNDSATMFNTGKWSDLSLRMVPDTEQELEQTVQQCFVERGQLGNGVLHLLHRIFEIQGRR